MNIQTRMQTTAKIIDLVIESCGDGIHIDIVTDELEAAGSLEAEVKVIRDAVEYTVSEELEALEDESEYAGLDLSQVYWEAVLFAFYNFKR